ncbi:MAG: DUF6132 family protein [Bacteroidota bacterium]
MKIDKSFLIKKVFPVAAGASLGYAYYYFIGCNSGACAITSNPWISTIYGGVAGLVFTIPSKKKADDSKTN